MKKGPRYRSSVEKLRVVKTRLLDSENQSCGVGVLYPSPGWLLPTRAARRRKRTVDLQWGKKSDNQKGKEIASTQKLNSKILYYC